MRPVNNIIICHGTCASTTTACRCATAYGCAVVLDASGVPNYSHKDAYAGVDALMQWHARVNAGAAGGEGSAGLAMALLARIWPDPTSNLTHHNRRNYLQTWGNGPATNILVVWRMMRGCWRANDTAPTIRAAIDWCIPHHAGCTPACL
jgi:hypothetical protein